MSIKAFYIITLDNVILLIIGIMFFRVPALKIFRAAHRPLKEGQAVDNRLSVRFLWAAVLCRHGTDRQKGTEHCHNLAPRHRLTTGR